MTDTRIARGASLLDFIWKNADDFWDDFKCTEFGKINLTFMFFQVLKAQITELTTRRSSKNNLNNQFFS